MNPSATSTAAKQNQNQNRNRNNSTHDATTPAPAPATAPTCNIVPIRVDVISEDKTLRIVDTLLFDPTCWPVTLFQPIHVSMEENITQMAHTILSDAEVQGMGRTVRHFTGRLELWTPKLQKAVEDQLRPQLWKIAAMHRRNQDCCNNIPMAITAPTTMTTPNEKKELPQPQPQQQQDETLVPISIRLLIDRIMVHEDILWDKHGRVSPFEFAEDMAVELNLPDEASVAIATTILEQLHGLSIDTTPDATLVATDDDDNKKKKKNSNKNNNTSSKSSSSSGAWTIDLKEHASIVTQVVAQHRTI